MADGKHPLDTQDTLQENASVKRKKVEGEYVSQSHPALSSREYDLFSPENPHYTPPSPVVHIRGASESLRETHLIEKLSPYGQISCITMMPKLRQALVEFEDVESAKRLVQDNLTKSFFICGRPLYFNFSKAQNISRNVQAAHNTPPSKILIVTILNPQYTVTTDILHSIFSKYGNVQRIVIFRKSGLQAMVEFPSVVESSKALEKLHGCDIYTGFNTLKIEFSKNVKRLNVFKNDSETWDYTIGPEPFEQDRENNPLETSGRTYFTHSLGASGPPVSLSHMSQSGMEHFYSRDAGFVGPGANFGSVYGGKHTVGQYPNIHGVLQNVNLARQGRPLDFRGRVLMVYGLNMERINCDRLFNLVCLYGNVSKIKILISKPGMAMLEMSSADACDRILDNLNGFEIFKKKLEFGLSRQAFITDTMNQAFLEDDTPAFKDYNMNILNRFTTEQKSSKNKLFSPARFLHFFNGPPEITEEEITQLFLKYNISQPLGICKFPNADKASSGLLEFSTKVHALESLIMLNNLRIPGKHRPYTFKLAYSTAQKLNR